MSKSSRSSFSIGSSLSANKVPLSFLFIFCAALISRSYHKQWHPFSDNKAGSNKAGPTDLQGSEDVEPSTFGIGMQLNSTGMILDFKDTQFLEKTKSSIGSQVDWLNSLLNPIFPEQVQDFPPLVQSAIRNCFFAFLVYFGLNFTWVYYIYECFGSELFPKHNMPTWSHMTEQMWVSVWALPLYSLLPTITEVIIEKGWTLSYANIADISIPTYIGLFCLYIFFVEFGVYWMHRGLHDIPAGYKYLHAVHHKYNKEHSMSPFAGLAFHPLDGILQALPYTLALFIVPMHFLTHEILLFATAFWTSNIHDNLNARLPPIMGAGWHTIHHTTYKHNYGHYFIIMDWFFGTLVDPDEFAKTSKLKQSQPDCKAVSGT